MSSNPEGASAVSGNFKVKACGMNREITPEEVGLRVVVSPNPSPEERLRIAVSGAEGQALWVELHNWLGQTVREQRVAKAGEEEVLDWDMFAPARWLVPAAGEQRTGSHNAEGAAPMNG